MLTRNIFASSLILASLVSQAVYADDISVDFKGFFSVVAGRVISSPKTDPIAGNPYYSCPCYLADWSSNGIYYDKWSAQPETRLGVQADVKFSDTLKFTGQATTRADDTKPQLGWAFLTYQVSPEWELQVGRKRVPLYYYSDYQDVGVAYPWVNPPPELYGWEVTNYNGVSMRYRGKWSGYQATASVFTGQETVHDDRYYLSSTADRTDASWKQIIGGDLELSKDWFTTRIVYLQANASTYDKVTAIGTAAKLRSYGIAINLDFDDWFVLSEFTEDDRNYSTNYTVKAPAYSVGAGYRYGAWTPFVNWGWYHERTDDSTQYAQPQRYSRASLSMRYDWNSTTAIKAQYDVYHEDAISNLTGNSHVIRIALDKTF